MNFQRIRSILALMVVGIFMFITAFLAIFPLVSKQSVDLTTYSDFYTKISSVYTGIVGVIVGYYFARNTKNDITKENKPL